MLGLDSQLEPNQAEVVAKVIDDEAIIMNLNNGVYYSMDGVGGFIWDKIENKTGLQDIAHAVTAAYEVEAKQAEADILALAVQLLEEKVVVESSETPPASKTRETPAEKKPYGKPELNVYRDMGDLLALDPPAPGLQDIPWTE